MEATFEIEIAAAPADVWRALTDPEWTRRWYYDSPVTGDWRPGGAVSYRFPDGPELENGVVVEIDEPRRLALETSFVWDDEIRAEPPHRTTWDLEAGGAGTLVRLRFDVPEAAPQAGHLLGEEGGYALKGLRLALDPAEQARVARRDVIGEVEIRDVTAADVDDYLHFFDDVGFEDHPEWQGCYCAEVSLAPDDSRTVSAKRAEMAERLADGGVTALLAYADGGPVAWCNYGETTRLTGVMAKLGLEPGDHERVGSIGCFVISSQYRRHGLARRLMEAACDRLKARGCTQVEAYPPKESTSDYPNYRGPLGMYLEAGFEPYRDAGRTQIVRRAL